MLGRVHSLSLLIKFSLFWQPSWSFLTLSSSAIFSGRVEPMLGTSRALQKDGRGMHLRQGTRPPRKNSAKASCFHPFSGLVECGTTQEEDNNYKRSIPSQTALSLLGGRMADFALPGMQPDRAGSLRTVQDRQFLLRSVRGEELERGSVCFWAEIGSFLDKPPAQIVASPPNPSACWAVCSTAAPVSEENR